MSGIEIFAPFFGMLLLTFAVWTVMYYRRIRHIVGNRINPQKFTTPEKSAELIPEEVAWPSNNLKNLFEMPVIFYALCLYLFVTGQVDSTYLAAAWLFLAFRIAHSVIHCTINIVRLRFASYMLATFTLLFMVIRAAVRYPGLS